MIKVDFSGFEKLQRELEEASEGLKSLDGEITKLVFTNFDPLDTARAIHQMEAAIDEKAGRYSRNPIIKPLVEAMKKQFRQRILETSSSRRNPSVLVAASLEDCMNPVVEKKRQQRFEYMNALYEATNGRELSYIDMAEIGMAIHLSREECEGTVEYLAGEGLLRYVALGGTIAITHLGVIEVETALQKPDEPTAHFPAVHNTINIGTMSNSVIQQGGDGSKQTAELSPLDKELISSFVTELSTLLSSLPLAPVEMQQLTAEVNTVKSQIAAPKPRIQLVVDGLKYIMGTLAKIGTSLLTSEAVSHLSEIEAFLHLH